MSEEPRLNVKESIKYSSEPWYLALHALDDFFANEAVVRLDMVGMLLYRDYEDEIDSIRATDFEIDDEDLIHPDQVLEHNITWGRSIIEDLQEMRGELNQIVKQASSGAQAEAAQKAKDILESKIKVGIQKCEDEIERLSQIYYLIKPFRENWQTISKAAVEEGMAKDEADATEKSIGTILKVLPYIGRLKGESLDQKVEHSRFLQSTLPVIEQWAREKVFMVGVEGRSGRAN